jgi:hypothetical protein
MHWLPPPSPGTSVCGGFDGSENDDWTAIRLETATGFQFTPRWRATDEPMIWNPAQHGGRMPRLQVHDAWAELAGTYKLERVYCDPGFNDPHDPTSWITEIEMWDRTTARRRSSRGRWVGRPARGPSTRRWCGSRPTCARGALTHDGCPITAAHIGNARKLPKPGDRFILGKPSQHQKIDAAVTSTLCHEAAVTPGPPAGALLNPPDEWWCASG